MSSEPPQLASTLGPEALHQAVLRNDPRQVRVIVNSAGTNIDAHDTNGATPLMLAVLMGRYEISRYLLRKNASLEARDDGGHSTLSYARDSAFTRRRVVDYENLGYRMSRNGQKDRLRLRRLLRRPEAIRASQERGNHPLSSAYIFRNGRRLEILQTISLAFPGRNLKDATSGFIASTAVPGIRMTAVSGWKADATGDPNVLHNGTYTARAKNVAEVLGFRLPHNFRDNGAQPVLPEHKGRFFCSHVEKQLVVWWVEKVLKAVLGINDIKRLRELRCADIPQRLKGAKIFLDHNPCGNVCYSSLT
ncbi:hypothetical protein B0H67DRAFT_493126 [Lasiosphaeris hirsuta]|uniref:Single-strand DNA deaminase toxin A-like C-terminal domain-containing protein n=1 Tax=Lasiosphaeris hirsuta TaxID=260670 RepID=A0AA40A9E3_9PEZI|nr:hypothetical protein B0H67DRAFT_493126 [Lasiosphaeris hirsuta]